MIEYVFVFDDVLLAATFETSFSSLLITELGYLTGGKRNICVI